MGTEVLVTHYSRRPLALSISCTELWQWWWTEIHTSATQCDTTIILTRNVTWNSSAPNATPITSYPLTRAMAGGAPCWPAQHCHLRAKALLNWLQPYSLVAWNREACLVSLLKFNMNIFPRWPEMLLAAADRSEASGYPGRSELPAQN